MAVQKYRWRAFEFLILQECDVAKLNSAELFWMGQFGTFLPLLGFNSAGEYSRLAALVQKPSQANHAAG